jgi:glycosyltransferase involved in cell wall biosynthesis
MRSLFCAPHWPLFPGHSGGEIRDLHLVRFLAARGPLEFFALEDAGPPEPGRTDVLRAEVAALHTPATLPPGGRSAEPFAHQLVDRLARRLRRARLPVPGRRFHLDVEILETRARFGVLPAVRAALASSPEFLFVSPQTNPIAMMAGDTGTTRTVLCSFDVEADRTRSLAAAARGVARWALAQEARRAARFERANLDAFDGVVAVSGADRERFVSAYGLPPERVIAVENGVDPGYFAFAPRRHDGPPSVVFVGHLRYAPNADGARRLLRSVMPLVRASHPDARLTVVGEGPPDDVRALHDGVRTVVTGRVDDVRPYLAAADVACYPLVSGSGTKFKVVEALAAGLPVVGSPVAFEGIEAEAGTHFRAGVTDRELADAVVGLLSDPESAARLAAAGRAHAVARYAWDAVLPRLGPWLDALRALPRREPRG